jgi:hypothetical protein
MDEVLSGPKVPGLHKRRVAGGFQFPGDPLGPGPVSRPVTDEKVPRAVTNSHASPGSPRVPDTRAHGGFATWPIPRIDGRGARADFYNSHAGSRRAFSPVEEEEIRFRPTFLTDAAIPQVQRQTRRPVLKLFQRRELLTENATEMMRDRLTIPNNLVFSTKAYSPRSGKRKPWRLRAAAVAL